MSPDPCPLFLSLSLSLTAVHPPASWPSAPGSQQGPLRCSMALTSRQSTALCPLLLCCLLLRGSLELEDKGLLRSCGLPLPVFPDWPMAGSGGLSLLCPKPTRPGCVQGLAHLPP